ncbi:MAG: hypothetical protein JO288_15070, partial [Hyphomicrobiales bacterium]|nr:hypothetical protein [Hyphomicrobiales bacterium]
MGYRAIYAYAWDLAEVGVSAALERFGSLGLDAVTMAGSYHAGKFLRPHGKTGKVYFPEDGVVYFTPDPARYGAIKPVPHSMVAAGKDVMRELVGQDRLATNVWLVLLHNTRLGEAHPEATVANAFGDHYVYNLCPSAPDARAYAIGLARDVTESYPAAGVSLETPGFLPYAHGYHHEFALNRPNRWLDSQLGLCFCEHCSAGAKRAGLTIEALRRQVAADIEAYLAADVDFPADMAEAFWLADARTDGELAAFLDWRCAVVTSLVREIREAVRRDATVAVIPSVARPTAGAWYEGSDLKALAEAAGIIEACFYEPSVTRIKADLHDLKRRLRGAGALRGILRPAFPDLEAKSEFLAAMRSLAAGGVREVAFYNWGHVRDANLDWIAEGLAELEA